MIGVFGGTFDPIHFGHLRPALEVFEALGLREMRMLPSRVPAHRDAPCAGAEQRLAMLRLALAGQSSLVVDTRELERGGPSYMVDTLTSLRAEIGAEPLCLVIGADAYLALDTWHRWRELPELAHIVVAHRPGRRLEEADGSPALHELFRGRRAQLPAELCTRPAGLLWLQPVTQLDISATRIRGLAAAGRSPRYLLPDNVLAYIREQRLYSPTQEVP
jgi:nicotinate-nucleotide adenylyltransferase